MAIRRRTTTKSGRAQLRSAPRKKRRVRDIYPSGRHPCQRCGKKIKMGRYCYTCGHYRLGLF